jgi:hypothetical protein
LLIALVALLSLPASTARAQTEILGSIVGVLTDETGAAVPRVMVSATSLALQTRQTSTLTDALGAYRLSQLPIGTYSVTYSLQGFETLKRDNIRVTAGFTAQINGVLKLGSMQETVTVAGASPVVDLTRATPATSLTREILELLPSSRNGVQAILEQAPSVRSNLDVAGDTVGAIPIMKAFGNTSGGWPVLEGLSIGLAGQSGVYLDYQSMEEAQVSALGNTAEVPTRGVLLSMIVKSGGDQFHGSATAIDSPKSLITDNVDAKLAVQGIRGIPILKRYDVGGDLGGFIVNNKLWFYGGIRDRVNNNAILDCLQPDGTACESDASQRFYDGKVTHQLTPSQRLIGYYQWNHKGNIGGSSSLVAWESRVDQEVKGSVGKGEWQGTFGSNVLVDILAGYWNLDSFNYGVSSNPSSIDITTQKVTGSDSGLASFSPTEYFQSKYEVKGSLTWYRPNGFAGSHNIKVGLDYIHGLTFVDSFAHTVTSDYILMLRSGLPFEIEIFNNPSYTPTIAHNTGIYVADQWRISPRLTLDLGARLEFDRGFAPAQTSTAGTFASLFPSVSNPQVDIAPWNTVVPRLRAAYAGRQ